MWNKIYHSKYFPRFFYTKPDGGKDSGVKAFFLIEWKILFSIGILKFNPGTREAYHSHAFNAYTWWLWGEAEEKCPLNEPLKGSMIWYYSKAYKRAWKPKCTLRGNIHKVVAETKCWAITLRGPWQDTWYEYVDGKKITLTHGRKVVWVLINII